MKKYSADELLKIAREKGWDEVVELSKGSDPCESQHNAVKVACKNVDPLHPGTACEKALKALAKCMDAHY